MTVATLKCHFKSFKQLTRSFSGFKEMKMILIAEIKTESNVRSSDGAWHPAAL